MRGRRPLSVGRRLRRITLVVLAGVALAGALGVVAGLSPRVERTPPWDLRRTTQPRRTAVFKDPRLGESSGVTASRRQPGILWTINDSGDGPWIYAIDTLGRSHAALEVDGARNVDWEAIGIGPCGRRDCLYIADTGDNDQARGSATIYRVPEPSLPAQRPRTERAESVVFTYPKGRWDVESAFVDSGGTVYLVTKGPGPPLVYRLPAESWRDDEPVIASDAGPLPIDTGSLGNRVTDAALSPSGGTVAIRTYLAIYLFTLNADGLLAPTGVGCDAAGLQLQGEGISWLDERVLVLTSEGGFGRRGTIILLECGAPVAAT